jgi:hypothetical protein
MTRLRRRLGILAVVVASVGTLIGAAAPSAVADTCITLPVGPVCVPAAAGVSTASPSSFANTQTAQVVTITDPLIPIYSALAGGVTVQLVGPGAGTDTYTATSPTIGSTTITATFDMTSLGLPAGPGSYVLTVAPAATPPTQLPVDSVAITITAGRPTPAARLAVQPGAAATASVATFGTPFARGDTFSFSDSGGTAVPGLTLTGPADATAPPVMSATAITGTLRAGSDVALGRDNLVVTDTADQVGSCVGCVVVTDLGPVTHLKAAATVSSAATVTFTPPTGSPSAVTGYDVTVSKTAASAATASGIGVQQAGTTPRASVTGLAPSTEYFVTVAARDASGQGVPVSMPFFTPHHTRLTVASTRTHLTAGEPLTLIGRLTHRVAGASSGLGGAKVRLFAKSPASTQPVKLATVQTDASGKYRYAFTPSHSAVYIAVFPGSPSTSSAPGDALTFATAQQVGVKPFVRLHAQVTSHDGVSWLALTGKVTPNQKGGKVVIDSIGSGGATKIGAAELTRRSTFTLIKRHLPPGTYRLRARITGSPTNAAAHSKRRTVTI